MRLSNSSRIAILFSFFTFFISSCFLIIFSFLYFKSWYGEEQGEAKKIYLWYNIYSNIFDEALWKNSKNKDDDKDDDKKKNNEFEKVFLNLYEKEDKYYIVKYINKKEYIKYDVTIFMKNQIMQFETWIILITIFTLIAFILSKIIFAKIILKELYSLSHKLEKLDISEWEDIENDFYDNDIKNIGNKINTLLGKIYNNQKDLKYFNSQVSHEFKTPLMIINSELEFLELSWINNDSLQKIQRQLDKLDNLLNSFITLTKIETTNIKKTDVNIRGSIYKNKDIKVKINFKKNNINTNKEIFYILLKNLLENAFKYTDNWWYIDIKSDDKTFIIKNSFDSDKKTDMDKIFKIFYRNSNNSNWFWIWLSIVKKIVDALWYKIKVESNEKEISFIINIINDKQN